MSACKVKPLCLSLPPVMNHILKYFLYLYVFALTAALPVAAQLPLPRLIQFSGVVVTGDSLKPLSHVNMMIRNTHRGTVSDIFGFFSFVAQEHDTIDFSHVGFKHACYIIPDSLQENRYSLIQMMSADTFLLQETVIYPWPTKEQFREAFMNLKLPDSDAGRAERNLKMAAVKEKMENIPMDGSLNYKHAMEQKMNQLYYTGQIPPNNLLNPFAWVQFIEAWKNGDFKRKK